MSREWLVRRWVNGHWKTIADFDNEQYAVDAAAGLSDVNRWQEFKVFHQDGTPSMKDPSKHEEWSDPNVDPAVLKKSYGWTISDSGEVYGLVAGDMGFDGTGIVIPVEYLKAWAEYNEV